MKFTWRPDLLLELVRVALPVAILFGLLKWTPEQSAGAFVVISAVITYITASLTTANATLEQAGTSKTQVVAAAAANIAAGTPGGTGSPNTPGGAGGPDAPKGLGNFSDKNSRGGTGIGLMIALLLLPASFVAPACRNADPNLSPERKVALYGIRTNTILKEVRTTAEGLYQQNVLPKPAYEKFLVGYIEVNKAGEQLADALAAYDAATSVADRDALVSKIDAAIVTFGTLLPAAVPELTNAEGRAKVSKLVGEVQQLIVTIARLTAPRTSRLQLPPIDLAIAA